MFLKPCPFCGEYPILNSYDMGGSNGTGYPGEKRIIICCDNEECFIKPCIETYTLNSSYQEALERAKQGWNYRKE